MLVVSASKRMSPSSAPAAVVLIRSSAYSSLPAPGNRVGPSDVANMPTIQASTGNNAIKTADGAHHYRLVGLNIKAPSASILQIGIVQIGGGETALNQFPTDITVDRCVIRGDPTIGARRGVSLGGIRTAVVDSYIYDIKEDGADSQAILSTNGYGPLKIVNNYLEAAGENVMIGGSDPTYANLVPSDIEIRRNYFKKQDVATWAASWSVKNLLEFKNAQRVLVEGNVLDTNYLDSQNGYSVLLTPRNQSNTAPWSCTRDITIRLNKLLNCGQGFNISGRDGDPYTALVTQRVTIQDNLLEVVIQNGEDGRLHGITNGPEEVQIINNTWVVKSGTGTCGFHSNNPDLAINTVWRNNVFDAGQYGILGTGTGEGTPTFSTYFDNPTYEYNVMYRSPNGQSRYPVANNQFPAAATDVFTDYANGDYTVKAAYQGDGSDGTDPGADISALNTATANAIDGQWGSEHATYSDHTYTNAELPRYYVDTTYANQTGTTHVCTTAAEFTTALANCAIGDIIELQAGNTFTGSFTLRNI